MNELVHNLEIIWNWLVFPLDPAFPLWTAIGLAAIVTVVAGIFMGERDRRTQVRIAKRMLQSGRTRTERPPPQIA